MKSAILILLFSSITAFAQPIEGPWVVLETSGDTTLQDIHVVLRNSEIADIFYIQSSPSDSVNQVKHCSFSLTTHELNSYPEILLQYDHWIWDIEDVLADELEHWIIAVTGYQSPYFPLGQDSNRTFLFRGNDELIDQAVLYNGYYHYNPQDQDTWLKGCDLAPRIGGGFVLSSVLFAADTSWNESDSYVEVRIYNTDSIIPDTLYRLNPIITEFYAYEPFVAKVVSWTRDSVIVLRNGVGYDALALTKVPENGDSSTQLQHCTYIDPPQIFEFMITLSNQMRVFVFTWPIHGIPTSQYLSIDLQGECNMLSGFSFRPYTLTSNSNLGFAAVSNNDHGYLGLSLYLLDTNAVELYSLSTFYNCDSLHWIAEEDIFLSNSGKIALLWKEIETSHTSQTLKIASANWNTLLDADEEGFTPSPSSLKLFQNYPNPFNPSTTLSFDLPQPSEIKLSVFDITGRQIETLAEGKFQAGEHSVKFDGANLPSGIYFARLETANGFFNTRKMVLLK